MLVRKQSPKKTERDWFFFSSALAISLASDYIALRVLYMLEPLTTAIPILGKALDVAEKSLKLFVMVSSKSTTALSSARSDFGHNIEMLRAKAAQYDHVFDDAAMKAFSKDLNHKDGKLYQHVRYGSEETTDGFEADLDQIMPVVDRMFIQSIMRLSPVDRKLLFFVSPLKHLLLGSNFDQTQNSELVLQAVRYRNAEIAEFEATCRQMEEEHRALAEQLNGERA